MSDFDLVVSGARVMDPETGLDEEGLNVGVRGGNIAALSREPLRGRENINGAGAALTPGFIDLHTHEDFPEDGEDGQRFRLPREAAAAAMRAGNTTIAGGNCGLGNYPLGEYLEALNKAALPINCLSLAGAGALRMQLGLGPYDTANPDQIAALKNMALEALDEGAKGISLGLQYFPGTSFDELLAMAEAAKERNTFFAVHMRHDTPGKAIETVEEVLKAARLSGAALQISHWAANVYGGDNIAAAARMIETASLPVTADVYPYDAWATTIKSAVFDKGFDDFNFAVEDLELLSGPLAGNYCTMELFDELRLQDHDTAVACHRAIPQCDIEAAYRLPFVCVGSDTLIVKNKQGRIQGHPRSAGTSARFLGDFVREKKVVSLMEGIKKLTLIPADRLGLTKKGRIQKGCDADLVLFDPASIVDRTEYGIDRCCVPPGGICVVICGGKKVYEV